MKSTSKNLSLKQSVCKIECDNQLIMQTKCQKSLLQKYNREQCLRSWLVNANATAENLLLCPQSKKKPYPTVKKGTKVKITT